MKRRITVWMFCLVAIIIWSGFACTQATKPRTMKMIELPTGEKNFDLNGEWDVWLHYYGMNQRLGSFAQVFKITQEGGSFVGVRMKDDRYNMRGTRSLQGELDKSGIKKVTALPRLGPVEAKGKISDNGNKIVIDDDRMLNWTLTRR